MNIYIHRVNTLEKLMQIPYHCGIEVDLRAGIYKGEQIVMMQHEAFRDGENFEDFMKHYQHNGIILNIKEAGIEEKVWDIVHQHDAEHNSWLLDVEFPYMFQATRGVNGKRIQHRIAVRYSEAEPLEFAEAQKGLLDWLWIDTNTRLPLDMATVERIKILGMKTCLVCPERWGRPEDISIYIRQLHSLNFKLDAVMTSLDQLNDWNKYNLHA